MDITENDFDILDKVVKFSPEIRLCALVLKAARNRKLRYPVKTYRSLLKLLEGKKSREVEGHILTPAHIKHYLKDGVFPIENENDLISGVYMGCMRCNSDMAWMDASPENLIELVEERKVRVKKARRNAK